MPEGDKQAYEARILPEGQKEVQHCSIQLLTPLRIRRMEN